MRWPRTSSTLLLAATLAACAPALDWRDVRPDASGAQLLMPCRPDSAERRLSLAGAPATLTLLACTSGDVTWALGHADVGEPARVQPALEALRRAALANLGAADVRTLALAVPGATPNAASGRWALVGRLPDGSAVQAQVAVFARGTRVFQATALGPALQPEGLETFFGSLRVGS